MIVVYDGTHMSNYNIFRHFIFLHFFKTLIFWFVRAGVKGQKTVHKMTNFVSCTSYLKKTYIISLSFMLHMCKRIISPGVFFIFFLNFEFWFLGSQGQRIA